MFHNRTFRYLGCLAVALSLTSCATKSNPTPTHVEKTTASAAVKDLQPSALDRMQTLRVISESSINRRPAGKYVRTKDFGKPWIDVDHNGCNTRDDMLQRSLTDKIINPDGCRVVSGKLHDPYTGKNLVYSRGDSLNVDIDHIVPLHRAWMLGAYSWGADHRIEFANDPENLIAVSHTSNEAKSDKGPGSWMPENKNFACDYATRYVNVSFKYNLPISDTDRDVLFNTLQKCV